MDTRNLNCIWQLAFMAYIIVLLNSTDQDQMMQGFPGGTVVKKPLPMQGTWV